MRNKKGFTLIEIIVSIMIASIGMMIAATIILNSMGYFDKTAVADHDKQALDGIKDYFQNELIYASEVKIANTKPDGNDWHWLYVKNDVLYRDNDFGNSEDIKVYLDEFYNRKKLKITARGYDKYRLILNFYLNNDDNKTIYKTATTIELLNFKEQINKETEGISPFSKAGNTVDLDNSSSTYKIYYKKGEIAINAQEENKQGITGTVADKLLNVDKNAITPYDPNKDYSQVNRKEDGTYLPGDFVKVGDKIYLCTWGYNTGAGGDFGNPGDPGAKQHWQLVQEEYDENSSYFQGDVIKYNGKYYRSWADNNVFTPNEDNPYNTTWEVVKRNEDNTDWVLVCQTNCK